MHLPWIDAVRGLAAMAVLLHHAYVLQFGEGASTGWHGLAFNWLLPLGHLAVDVFICLSGYCLALSANRKLISILTFFKRRARRILPPFYAALGFAAIANFARLSITGGTLPFTLQTIAVNLLLLQDLFPDAAAQFSITNWSIAFEAKIYLLFPILLLVGRWRIVAAITFAGLIAAIAKVLQPSVPVDYFCPWYVILFAFGMNAANARQAWRVGVVAGAIALTICLTIFHYTPTGAQALFKPGLPLIDLSAGLLVSSLFTWWRFKPISPPKWLVGCGLWSYSLYLTHYPLLQLCNAIAAVWTLNQLFVIVVEPPIVLLFAHCFFKVFERPWLK